MSTRAKKQRRAMRAVMREMAANVAPSTLRSAPLQTSASALRMQRQNKHNPLPYLKPETLSRALDAFEHGRLREAALLWEKMAERDDMISSVKPKREKDVSQLDMQVVTSPDSGSEGEEHKAILEKFWKGVRAVNAYDRNERGGFRRLVKQMMTSASYKYAAHHIVWNTRSDGELTATFEFVPLWMFENTTGKLRYLRGLSQGEGDVMDDGEWMVTTGDGLMIACSIGYLAKRSAFNDWLIFSEKFSVPGVLGRTSAQAGSPEAIAMEEAVEAFGHDWVAVITGDDGAHKEPISLVQAQGNPGGMPMPAVIERVDRRIASLYRGADLSSMSSTAGEGTGASLQEKETDILRRDDAETIAETLEEVSRMVIEWHFGTGVPPLARVELVVPVQEDATSVIDAASKLADRGAKISVSALTDRLNLPLAKDDADALKPASKDNAVEATGLATPVRPSLSNSENRPDAEVDEFIASLRTDLKPLGDALASAMQIGDYPAVKAALRRVSLQMPELTGDASALAETLGLKLADAFTGGGESEEVENSGTPDGARKGWQTRRANGWTSARAIQEIKKGRSAIDTMLIQHSDQLNAFDHPDLGAIDLRWGNPKGGMQHIIEKHGTVAAKSIPAILFSGQVEHTKNRAWVDTPDAYVLLAKDFQGQPSNHWVITSYLKK